MAIPAHKPPYYRHILPLRHHPGLARRVGIMGGSFNPAHNGHIEISLSARKTAQLDEVWWLVSPQNPLKQTDGMASFSERISYARTLALPPWIRISDFEITQPSCRTIDTLTRLKQIFRCSQLIWIMGADNLIELPRWQAPRQIMRIIDVMVMGRPGFNYHALAGKGAAIAGRQRRRRSARLRGRGNTGWYFHHHTRNSLSATAIRTQTGRL